MERAFYCKYDSLRHYCEDENSWQFSFLKSLPSIHVQTAEEVRVPKSFEEYKDMDEGRSGGALATIENFKDKLNCPIIPINDSLSIEYGSIANCIFDGISIPKEVRDFCGVEVLDNSFAPLQRHWFQNVDKGSHFTWDSFFKQGKIPSSNSVIIMDRYLLKVGINKRKDHKGETTETILEWYKRGGKNIAEILKAIIPQSFSGTYNVLVVFDDKQIEKMTQSKEFIPVEEALTIVSRFVQSKLALKNCQGVNLEFLAIHDGLSEQELPKGINEDEKMTHFYLKELYKLTHDRRLITNYYMVNATHGWDATDKSTSTETQTFYFDAILSGMGNPDQMDYLKKSIPINYVQSFINSFVQQLSLAKVSSYKCFRFEDNELCRIGIESLKNSVLRMSSRPVEPQDWDTTDRLFQRDALYSKKK